MRYLKWGGRAQELVGVGRKDPGRKWEFREVIIAQEGAH